MLKVNDEIDPQIWNKFCNNKAYYRYEWFYIIKNSYNLRPLFVLSYEEDKFAFIASFKTNKSYLSLPFVSYSGFLFNDVDRLNELKEHLIKNDITISARELIENPDIKKTKYVNPILELDSLDGFLSSVSKNTRNQFRNSEKSNLNFAIENSVDNFYKIYAEGMRNLGTPLHGINYLKEIVKNFPVEVFTVYDDKYPIGSMFCIHDHNTLYVLYAYTKPKFSKKYANYFLYLKVITWAINNNFEFLDMGRSAYDSGTYHFKKKFRPTFFEIKSNTNYSSNKKLKVLSEIWKKLPLPIANFIGPRVRRYLP